MMLEYNFLDQLQDVELMAEDVLELYQAMKSWHG
jgi:hypothetical protein